MSKACAHLVVACFLTAGPPPGGKADKPAAVPGAADLDKLIEQLGEEPATREKAARRLEAIGAPALPALRRAARTASGDTSGHLRLWRLGK